MTNGTVFLLYTTILVSIALRYPLCNGEKFSEGFDYEIRDGECGGTFEMDRGTLTYFGDGSVQPGEVCVWTIHLQTMDGFRFNFAQLNLPGGNTSCHLASVGIYGLTNFIPRDDFESYRLCNENNDISNYILSNNIAAVVFYASVDFPSNNPMYGFSLDWEGSTLEPVPTEHSSIYQIAPRGNIWYEGEYSKNSGITWLTKAIRLGETSPTLINVDVIFVDLENCTLVNKCLCDAMIIYDISPLGELHEVERFCGDETSGQFENVNSNFIVAFYTDAIDIPGSGFGFQVVWRQASEIETTTEVFTTTTEIGTTGPPIVTECGGVVVGQTGVIDYKSGQSYSNNELCIWTIRLETPYTQIELTKYQSGFQLGHDYISAFTFVTLAGLTESVTLGETSNSLDQVTLNGSVAIVQFSSDASTTGTGFLLHFQAVGDPATNISYYRDEHSVAASGNLLHPYNETRYFTNELSTFVVSTNTINEYVDLFIDYIEIQPCNVVACLCDGLIVYKLDGNNISLADRLCGVKRNLSYTGQTFIFIFYSDGTSTSTSYGFQFNWTTLSATTPQVLFNLLSYD